MDYIENDNDHIGGTTQQLRNAIEQSVRGWVNSEKKDSMWQVERDGMIEDLTQHLFGNVVMALRFGTDIKTLCVHGFPFGQDQAGIPHSITRCGSMPI